MIHNYRIEYENVILRPLEKNDIESLRIWRNNPLNTLYLNKIPYITPSMQICWFQKYIHNNFEMCFSILENQYLHRMVGSLSLYNFKGDACEFGKFLIGDEEAHGRKIGINSTMAATIIAFDMLGLREVFLSVHSDNIAAFEVYKKAGFIVYDRKETGNGKNEYIMTKNRR